MVQVYFSKITDLLLDKDEVPLRLSITKDSKYGVVQVKGATKVKVDFTDPEELKKVYYRGLDNRAMRSTDINETSSRSHLIFSIFIEKTRIGQDRPFKIGKITFIDLAGSEMLNQIGVNQDRFFEGMQINEGLQCMGLLIRQASLKVRVNYDLHLLTQLMQDSLGGNSKTLMIACISPSIYDLPQTRETLDYAMTTGTIKNQPTSVNLDKAFIKKVQQKLKLIN